MLFEDNNFFEVFVCRKSAFYSSALILYKNIRRIYVYVKYILVLYFTTFYMHRKRKFTILLIELFTLCLAQGNITTSLIQINISLSTFT